MNIFRKKTKSRVETIALGRAFAAKLKPGDVVALYGDLGAGKTVFTKGIALGLGVGDARYVNSPTFVMVKEYRGKVPLYHFDLYRQDHESMIDTETMREYLEGEGVSVIEWAGKIEQLLPERHYRISISTGDADVREISIERVGRARRT